MTKKKPPPPLYDPECPPRYSTVPDLTAENRLTELTVLAKMLGLTLMPHQRHILAVMTERLPGTDEPRYKDITLTLPRQASKTTMLMLMALDRMLAWGEEQTVVYVAQALVDAVNVWLGRPMQLIRKAGLDESAGLRFQRSLSDPKLVARNGSMLRILASGTTTSGQGSTLGLVIYDEAFSANDSRVELSLKPALRTIPDSQFVVASTAGDATSTYLKRRVEDGRHLVESGAEDTRIAYIEWSADDDANPYDEDVWRSAIPSLGHTVRLDDLRIDAEKMPESDWRRTGLNQWVTVAGDPIFSEAGWRSCQTEERAPYGGVVLGLDCTPDRAAGSLVACDPVGVSEVVSARQGVDWLVPEAVHIYREHDDVHGVCLLGGASASAGFADELRALNVPFYLANRTDYVAACGMLVDVIQAGGMRVVTSELFPRLDMAVKGAIRAGADGFIWARLDVTVDISPLVALTLAHWAARREKVDAVGKPSIVRLDDEALRNEEREKAWKEVYRAA